jgi:hypothetical protein
MELRLKSAVARCRLTLVECSFSLRTKDVPLACNLTISDVGCRPEGCALGRPDYTTQIFS